MGAHLEYFLAGRAAPLDAKRLGFAPGITVQEADALEEKGLLEGFCRRDREGDAVGDFRDRRRAGRRRFPKGSS